MGMISVQVDATKANRSLVQPRDSRRIATADPSLAFWVRMIEQCTQDAKRTHCGFPTDGAILARWWIAEQRPPKEDTEQWEWSFERACIMLDLDVEEWRERLLIDIDAKLKEAYELHVQSVMYVRRAMVLACAGIPTAISRQYLLPLVAERDYEHVAGIDHGDQYVMYDQAPKQAA